MALTAYLRLKSQTHGIIKGSVTTKGRSGSIAVIAAEHEVHVPTDPSTGLVTGKRVHHPFTITKEVDVSSPMLYTLLVTNDLIVEWELQFWRPAPGGGGIEQQYYTVKLQKAAVRDVKFHMPNVKNPELVKYAAYEEVAFSYQGIEWTWTDGELVAQDAFE